MWERIFPTGAEDAFSRPGATRDACEERDELDRANTILSEYFRLNKSEAKHLELQLGVLFSADDWLKPLPWWILAPFPSSDGSSDGRISETP